MHGVPVDLDLSAFHGARLDHVTIAEFIITFVFDPVSTGAPAGRIAVEGAWELVASDGRVIDRDQEQAARDCYRLHEIIGKTVTTTAVDAPRAISLFFDAGLTLRIFDDGPQYESFSIQPGDVCV